MIKITNCAGSLGDCLSLTPLFKKERGVVTMLRNPVTENILSRVYDGIADVEFVDTPVAPCPETNDNVCFSQRVLNHFGIQDVSAIPLINVTSEEAEWAKEFLKDYTSPVAFNRTVGKPSDHPLAKYRQIPKDVAETALRKLVSYGHTPLHFGLSANYEPIENCVPILDLPIRQFCACYRVIQQYVGADTGDYHLMLAVGGRCYVFVPPSVWHYNHERTLYFDYAWKNEPNRVEYYQFNAL